MPEMRQTSSSSLDFDVHYADTAISGSDIFFRKFFIAPPAPIQDQKYPLAAGGQDGQLFEQLFPNTTAILFRRNAILRSAALISGYEDLRSFWSQ